MTRQWTPDDIQRMMVCTTACLCLLIFVGGTLWLVAARVVGPTALGLVSGSGLLGIGVLLVSIIKIAIKQPGVKR